MSRGFVGSRSNSDEVNCGFFRRGETRYLSARENENYSERNENLEDGIHNFDREMNTGWFPQNHSGSVDVNVKTSISFCLIAVVQRRKGRLHIIRLTFVLLNPYRFGISDCWTWS